MPRTKLPKGSVPVTFRLPLQIQKVLTAQARREKISVSELVRRALRREIGTATPKRPQSKRATDRGGRD